MKKRNQIEVIVKLPKLYGWQKDLVNSPKRHNLVAVSRRAGKTYTATYIATKSILSGKKVLWLAPFTSQTTEIFNSIVETCFDLILKKNAGKSITLITKGHINFQSTEEYSAIRSKGYDLIIWDEMAHSRHISDIWTTMRPTLAENANTRFLGISTPNGLNEFHEKWQELKEKQEADWGFTIKDWTCSPHLLPDEMEKLRIEMGDGMFKQEMCACFLQIAGSMFPSEYWADIWIEQMPNDYQRSCVAIDLSLGKEHSDWMAVVFVGVKDGVLYLDCDAKLMPIEELVQFVKLKCEYYKPEFSAWESNGFQILACESFQKLFNVPPRVVLVDNRVKKETRIQRLDFLLKRGQIKVLRNNGGKEWLKEAVNFPNPTRDKAIHDDLLDATEMGWRALTET